MVTVRAKLSRGSGICVCKEGKIEYFAVPEYVSCITGARKTLSRNTHTVVVIGTHNYHMVHTKSCVESFCGICAVDGEITGLPSLSPSVLRFSKKLVKGLLSEASHLVYNIALHSGVVHTCHLSVVTCVEEDVTQDANLITL